MSEKVKQIPKRDPQKTRMALLHSGIEQFSEKGYHGTSVDQIVTQAGCNKRMLYHYFGNKSGLYLEVLREVFGKLETHEIEGVEKAYDTEATIREIIAKYFDFLQQNPDFVNLLMWENLDRARFVNRYPTLISKTPILERLTKAVENGIEKGEIEADVDSRHLLILLIGVCYIYFSNQYTLSHTLNINLRSPSILREGLQMAQRIVINGLLTNTHSLADTA